MPNDGVPSIGLALSGGGSRAIAFHLGCLRALNDLGILPKTRVISSVSGGSVIAAMYAYSDESFDEFDARVVSLLRSGLVWSIARHAFLSTVLPRSLLTTVTAGLAAFACDTGRSVIGLVNVTGLGLRTHREWQYAPLRRHASCTVAFEHALAEKLFSSALMPDVARPGLDIVINATELRTQTAFRFGSQSTGSWRFGRIPDNRLPVAKAVAASAAYPVLLPALDEMLTFERAGVIQRARVILTDGGIYDNLGVTCLEPGRSSDVSTNVFHVDYIVCCDAGHGQPEGTIRPYWWRTRMQQSFETTHRRVQTTAYARLHDYVETGELAGFVMPYLGQQDERLPFRPRDLVSREQVVSYPTNFSAMSAENINRLALRGEQLTRLLVTRYTPEL